MAAPAASPSPECFWILRPGTHRPGGLDHVGDAEKDRVAATAAGVGTFVLPGSSSAGILPPRRSASETETRIRARRGIRTEVVSG